MSLLVAAGPSSTALAAAPAAAPVTPNEVSTTPPTPAGSPSAQRATLSKDGDDASCEAVRKRLPELTRRGQSQVACEVEVVPGLPPDVASARGSVSPSAWVPEPSWCGGDWLWNRTMLCRDETVTVAVLNSSGAQTGTLRYWRTQYNYTNSNQSNWGNQVSFGLATGTTGTGYGTQVTGVAYCGAYYANTPQTCTANGTNSFGPSNPLNLNFSVIGESYFQTSSTAPGAISYSTNRWNITLSNPQWSNVIYSNLAPPGPIRCDNATPGKGVGCVFSGYTPAAVWSATGPRSEFAKHVQAAQNSGLPGAYPSGTPLTRTTNSSLRDQNGAAACPPAQGNPGWERPAGEQCDEYPFRSTYQGAFTGGGSPRTFNSIPGVPCDLSFIPTGSGPSGYSVCMINADHNSMAGSDLGTFYGNNRIVDYDPFRVWIQP